MALRTDIKVLYSAVQPINVEFEAGSATVKSLYYTEIERISKKITNEVHILGHTDNVGKIEYNQKLSQDRADAVKDILVNKYNIPADKVVAIGYGMTRPIADNSTAEGRERNRRIEMRAGVDISGDIANYLKSLTFTDNSSDSLDDISLVLHDTEDVWLKVYQPQKGDRLQIHINDFVCGDFEIDEIIFSGYPKQLDIKAISAPPSKNARRELKNRAWENVKLSQILSDIAKSADFKIVYDVLSDIEYDRKDQREESDIMFLKKICDDNCFSLKVTSGKIVIFDPIKYEKNTPSFELNQSNILNYSFRTQSHDLYTACTVEYYDEWLDEVHSYTHRSNNGGMMTGQTLTIKKRVTSLAEAKELAEKSLRKENRKETIATFNLAADFNNRLINPSTTFMVSGFGVFDGKYMIDKATHSVQTGYNIEIECHKVVE